MKQKILAAIALSAVVLMPGLASAQTTTIVNFCSILSLVNTVLQWFGILVFLIAIAAILYAAFLFLTAGGNEESLSTAKKVLIYGIIGIAVALLATNAVAIVQATTGGKIFSPTNCTVAPSSTL